MVGELKAEEQAKIRVVQLSRETVNHYIQMSTEKLRGHVTDALLEIIKGVAEKMVSRPEGFLVRLQANYVVNLPLVGGLDQKFEAVIRVVIS